MWLRTIKLKGARLENITMMMILMLQASLSLKNHINMIIEKFTFNASDTPPINFFALDMVREVTPGWYSYKKNKNECEAGSSSQNPGGIAIEGSGR